MSLPSRPTLLLDIGNTRLKWGWATAGKLREHGALAYRADDIESACGQAFASVPPAAAVRIASVAGAAVDAAVTRWLGSAWGLEPRFLHTTAAAGGVSNGYENPAQLGVDRWLALLAARRLTSGPCLVVSAGTAITIDALLADGRHLGGLILPGLNLMAGALGRNTAGVPDTPYKGVLLPGFFGHNTADGVGTGTFIAALECVQRSAKELARHGGEGLKCLLTGGDGRLFTPHLSLPHSYEPHLVLLGMLTTMETN